MPRKDQTKDEDDANCLIAKTIVVMRTQMSPTFLLALDLIDLNGKEVTPRLPLEIKDTDPPIVTSAKHSLNCLYHLNTQKFNIDELQRAESLSWWQKIKILPLLFQLSQNIGKQFKSTANFFKNTSNLLDIRYTEIKKQVDSIIKEQKHSITALIAEIDANNAETLAAAEKKLKDLYALINTTDFATISTEQKQNILKIYNNFLMTHYMPLLTHAILFETQSGLASGSISNYVFQATETIHQIMSIHYTESFAVLLPFETLKIKEKAIQASITHAKEQYIEIKSSIELLNDFIKFMQNHGNTNLSNLTPQQHAELKAKYIHIKSYFAAYAPKYDEFLMQASSANNKTCQDFIRPLEMLLQNCNDIANENYFAYAELTGKPIDTHQFKTETPSAVRIPQEMFTGPTQLRNYKEDKTSLNLGQAAIVEADKIAKLRLKLELELKNKLSNEVLQQLGWHQDNTNPSLPYTIKTNDHLPTKCIKALLNSLYHSEEGLRHYGKSTSQSGFLSFIFKIYYSWRAWSHIDKTLQNAAQLEKKSRLLIEGSLINPTSLANFAANIANTSSNLLANIFEKASHNLFMYSHVPDIETIFNKFNTIFSELSTLDCRSEAFREKVFSEFKDAIKFIDKLTHTLPQESEQVQGLEALKKFYPIIEKIITDDKGQFDAKNFHEIQLWLDNNWLDLIHCFDSMEAHYGLKHQAISSLLQEPMKSLLQKAHDQGVTLKLPKDLKENSDLQTTTIVSESQSKLPSPPESLPSNAPTK